MTRNLASSLSLGQARSLLAAIAASASDAIISTTLDDVVTGWNPAAERIFGYTADEMLGQPLALLAAPGHEGDSAALRARLGAGQEIAGFATARRAKDGRVVRVALSLALLRDDDGAVVGSAEVVRALPSEVRTTDRAQPTEALYRALAVNLPNGAAFLLDRDLRYQLAEGQALAAVGLKPADLEGKTIWEALPAELARSYEPRLRSALAGAPFQQEHEAHGRFFSTHGVPITTAAGEVYGVLAVSYDITERKQAEEQLRLSEERLRLSEERFRAFMDNSPAAAWISDPAGRLLYLSATYLKMFLLPEGGALGRSVFDLYPSAIAEEYVANMQAAVAAGRPVEATESGIRADGSRGVFLVYKFPLADPRGTLVGGVALDITELKEAAERFQLLAEANPIGILQGTVSGGIRFCNSAFCALTGYAKADFESSRIGWRDITPPEWREVDRRHLTEAQEQGVCAPYEKEFVRKDGTRVPVIVGYALFGEGREQSAAFIMDLSAQKRAEAERERLVAQLQETDRRKDEFLATLAHELRNPLAPLRTGLSVLRRSGAIPEGGPPAKTVEMMERQLGYLVQLVDDLLDIARLSQGKISLRKERLGAADLVGAAIEACQPLVDAKGHRLTVALADEPLPVEGDRTRLVQVLTNLVNNAAKYTEPGGDIGITIRRELGEVVFTVTDTGVGIAANELPSVWSLFNQVRDTLDKAQGGLGIGLSLVKKLVEMHGGTVRAESPGRGQGSTFIVRLPLAAEGPAVAAAPVGSAPACTEAGRRVLVVDDNVDAAESLALLLGVLGHQTEVVHTGPAVLEAAQRFAPEVVFLDIGLPGIDGYEVARRLRAEPGMDGVVLVALTGWGSEEDKRRSRAAGFDFHMTKPADPALVQRILARLA